MSAPINDGGPAFPGEAGEDGYGNSRQAFSPSGERSWINLNQGMSLRDWFAGQALNGLMMNYADHDNNIKTCVEIAINAADVMIATREGRTES